MLTAYQAQFGFIFGSYEVKKQGHSALCPAKRMDWHSYWIWLGIASAVSFVLYGLDKAQSKRGAWRVPEVVFHGLALSGGFPGGWAGRAVFRHKTRKPYFVFVLVVSTVAHLWLAYWLFVR